ncbi:PIN domain-containing protein [Oceanithermus sp.]
MGTELRPRVFLDANVLFSASLSGSVWDAIWSVADTGGYELVSSPFALVEARENLRRKRSEALGELSERLHSVRLVPEAEPEAWMAKLLPEKDRPILAAAVAAGCRFLLTGDTRHFGELMEWDDLPVRVLTPARFIRTFRP